MTVAEVYPSSSTCRSFFTSKAITLVRTRASATSLSMGVATTPFSVTLPFSTRMWIGGFALNRVGREHRVTIDGVCCGPADLIIKCRQWQHPQFIVDLFFTGYLGNNLSLIVLAVGF